MQLIEQFKAMNVGENIILRIDNEEAVKEIAYLALKNDSYESLFRSAIENKTVDCSFDIEKFLTLYSENYIFFKQKLQEVVHSTIGNECYVFAHQNNIQWEINYNLSLITFYK